MEALIELSDLISQSPSQFLDKISWLCSRCPPSDVLLSASPRVTRSHLHAILAVSRFLSKSSNVNLNNDGYDHRQRSPKSAVFEFLRAIHLSFHSSFWPQSYGLDSISLFYSDFFRYLALATELSSDFYTEVSGFMGEAMIAAVNSKCTTSVDDDNHSTNSSSRSHLVNSSRDHSVICREFLKALAKNFPPILPSDGERLINLLLDSYVMWSTIELSDTSSSQSSPASATCFHSNEGMSPVMVNGENSIDVVSSRGSIFMNGGFIDGVAGLRQQVATFEDESVDSLEKQEIAFKLIGHVLERVRVDPKLSAQVRVMAKKQLQSLSAFLKMRKRDWTEQGSNLKARINAKLNVYQAAAGLKIKCITSLDSDGKTSKKLLLETLALLIDASESCLYSVWRKLKSCEELFASLLSGVAQIVNRGGQFLRILLIRLKPLVLSACAQADASVNSHGAMFESVMRTSCEIIKHGWSKERAPVDTFIMGLATSVRERNDYAEQEEKEKQTVPVVQLNIIRLLADITVSINKPEVVDMILPLFVESLEEGDASTPGVMRLRLLDAISRMASLGFEKSYRETVVLLTRSYLSKLASLGSAENKTSAPDITVERLETLPSGFQLIATGLTNEKLRSDYRHRILSLCSDVGLAAESKNGRFFRSPPPCCCGDMF